MPRPTLLQKILHEPSQTYASQTRSSGKQMYYVHRNSLVQDLSLPVLPDVEPRASGSMTQSHSHFVITDNSTPLNDDDDDDDDDHSTVTIDSDSDDNDMFFTPPSSPRHSIVDTATPAFLASRNPPQPTSASASTASIDSLFSIPTRPTSPPTSLSSSSHEYRNPDLSRTLPSQFASTPSDLPPPPSRTYADEVWVKDVRWLIPPSSTAPQQHRSPSRSLLPLPPHPQRGHARALSAPVAQQPSYQKPGPSNGDMYAPRSSRTSAHNHLRTHMRSGSLMASMDVVFEEKEEQAVPPPPPSSEDSNSEPAATPSARPRPRTLSSPPTSRPASSVYARESRLVSVPDSTAVVGPPSMGTRGYTSLVLPRAQFHTFSDSGHGTAGARNGAVDLTRTGLAQTTMASVEIVRGIAEGRRRTLRWPFLSLPKRRAASSPAHPLAPPAPDLGLAFSHHRAPPTRVPGGGVLVQVWAVALDGVDAALACARAAVPVPAAGSQGKGKGKGKGRAEVGWVPGRAFVGRVLEVGWEVRPETCRWGDWVVGLLDVRKCGALTEFVVVDRRRVHRIPHPHVPVQAVSPAIGPPLPPTPAPAGALSLAECALLPLAGDPAWRAARILGAGAVGPQRGRVLVLGARAPAGTLAVRVLAQAGWAVHALLAHGAKQRGSRAERAEEEEEEERLLHAGAEEVLWDDDEGVRSVLRRLAAERAAYDAVLDCIGGRDARLAAETLLLAPRRADAAPRRFVTLHGDAYPARAGGAGGAGGGARGVRCARVRAGADVDWEGAGVDDALAGAVGALVRRAPGARARGGAVGEWVEGLEEERASAGGEGGLGIVGARAGAGRVVPLERAPEALARLVAEGWAHGGGWAVVTIAG